MRAPENVRRRARRRKVQAAKFKSKERGAPSLEMPEIGYMHKAIQPSILYFGTPVVLISTRNEDGATNVAPMSSAWFLGWGCMIGLVSSSKTPENLLREQ